MKKSRTKRISAMISMMLVFTMMFGMGSVFAEEGNEIEVRGEEGEFVNNGEKREFTDELNENQGIILNTQYFNANGDLFLDGELAEKSKGGIMRGPIYPAGTIKIDDDLRDTSGIFLADSKSAVGTTILKTSIKIASNVPVIGTYVKTGSAVIGWLKPYFAALDRIDYSKNMKIETSYSYRNFLHIIKAYTEQGTWREVGSSLSKYYYKHVYIKSYDTAAGDYVTSTKDFTQSKGFSPEYIAKAKNYMNYSTLSRYGSECYIMNKTYHEHC